MLPDQLDFNLKPADEILVGPASITLACVLIVKAVKMRNDTEMIKLKKKTSKNQKCHLRFFIRRRKIQNFKQRCSVGQN